jgi:hypothetical protein
MRDGGRHGAGEIAGGASHIAAHQGRQQDKNKWAQAIMIARGCSLRVSGDVHEAIFVADDSKVWHRALVLISSSSSAMPPSTIDLGSNTILPLAAFASITSPIATLGQSPDASRDDHLKIANAN